MERSKVGTKEKRRIYSSGLPSPCGHYAPNQSVDELHYTTITPLELHNHYSSCTTQPLLLLQYTTITPLAVHNHYSSCTTKPLLLLH